jgi:hypothetical protein
LKNLNAPGESGTDITKAKKERERNKTVKIKKYTAIPARLVGFGQLVI